MVEHRRTPSRRAYTLPGWFFGVTAVVCVVALGLAAWTFRSDDLGGSPAPATSASASTPAATTAPRSSAPASPQPEPRPTIEVEVLNASGKPGLAANTAKAAEKAGWTVTSVGNWQYGASHEAVYYPEGREEAAQQLADDLDIDAVEPAKTGMKISQLTVLVLN
jgi:hypothetical protein